MLKMLRFRRRSSCFMNGANHYSLLGLEITRQVGCKGSMTLVAVDRGGIADHIILDRRWLHGTAQDETQDGSTSPAQATLPS